MFLMTLRGAFQDYVINAAALIYLHEQDAPETLINRLIEPDDQVFADEDAWTDHLIGLGITGTKAVRLASEAAVAGSLDHLLPDAVIVSDGAGQFDVLRHGLCWIHAERLIHRLVTVTEEQRAAVALVRHLIWWFYRDLKLYRTDPSAPPPAPLKGGLARTSRAPGPAPMCAPPPASRAPPALPSSMRASPASSCAKRNCPSPPSAPSRHS